MLLIKHRYKYDFVDSKIENTFSDALDADFGTGNNK